MLSLSAMIGDLLGSPLPPLGGVVWTLLQSAMIGDP